jgi:tetratricopeptide (TPR) repeat protein
MTEYSSEYYFESDPALIERFETMLANGESYFFDVEDIEAIADYYLERGNHNKATKAIDHGLAIHPGASALMLKQAHSLVVQQQPKQALKILDFLEATEPTNTEMLLFKAVVHRNLADHEGTKACLMKALKAAPDNKEEIFLDLAFEQEMVDDFEGAIQSLKQSLEINPEHEASIFELGYCFDMADNLENGVEYFNKFLDEHPYSFVGWYNLALCYEKLGLFELAIQAADYCIAIRDDFSNAYILKGNLYTNLEEDRLAIEAYREALGRDSQLSLVYTAIGECYERLGELAKAESNYRSALDLDEHYVDAILGMGAVKEAVYNYTEALAWYKLATELDNGNPDHWHIYAETLTAAGRLRDAERTYGTMIEHFGDDEESWMALADVQATLYGHNRSLETIQRAMGRIPQSTDLIWHLVKHLLSAGKMVQAEHTLTEALCENPQGAEYFLNIYPEAAQFPNIAALIEIYVQSQSDNEL